ncbi:unnamed protein product [Absidia cylindrospora]
MVHLYQSERQCHYRYQSLSRTTTRILTICGGIQRYIDNIGALPPHVYQLGNQAYLHMRRTGIDQFILISGETGLEKHLCADNFFNILYHSVATRRKPNYTIKF